jgi:predicted HicB family RNase H-like nuclease
MPDRPRRRHRTGSETRHLSVAVTTRFSPEDHARVVTAARAAGMTVAEYVRHQALASVAVAS